MSRPGRRSSERRRSDRHDVKIPVDYSAVDAFFTEFCSNIHEGGMFVETTAPQEPGASVALQVRLPGLENALEIEGRVAWVSDGKADAPAGMGVQFIGLDAEARETINDVVRRLRARR